MHNIKDIRGNFDNYLIVSIIFSPTRLEVFVFRVPSGLEVMTAIVSVYSG